MSVHQRKDGRWFVSYFEGPKRKWKYFGKGEDAHRSACAWDAEWKSRKAARNTELSTFDYKAQALELLRLQFVTGKMGTPDLIDALMGELDIPITFDQIRKFISDTNATRRKGIPATLRYQVLERDRNTCCKCGASAPDVKLHVDHIKPVSRGGLTEERNLQTLCETCNMGKSNNIFFES